MKRYTVVAPNHHPIPLRLDVEVREHEAYFRINGEPVVQIDLDDSDGLEVTFFPEDIKKMLPDHAIKAWNLELIEDSGF